MSGHSKWSTIKRQKESTDAQRGKLFTKLARSISIAVKESGGITDPESNFKLRLAIEKAKQANLPKVNINNAIDSGAGKSDSAAWQEYAYEGYGPAGVAAIIQVITDNHNRTLSEIKQIFDRHGGVFGQAGTVNFLFDKLGWILTKPPSSPIDAVLLSLMEIAGIRDIQNGAEGIEIWTEIAVFNQVRNQLKNRQYEIIDSELTYKPKILKTISDSDYVKVKAFVEKLMDNDDIQQVWCDILYD